MSTPNCIRLAIETCKPCKTSFTRSSVHARPFSSTSSRGRTSTESRPVTVWIGGKPLSRQTPSAIKGLPTPNSLSTKPAPSPETSASLSLLDKSSQREEQSYRPPRNVAAAYLKPLRRTAEYGVPSCDLQLRSYSVRNVEFMADFAMRAAYYLGLPASGPVPLPKMIERWTMPRSNFVHKKSQENFERITLRRVVQIQDGHPETVQVWLAFLRKHAFYGVGMKANVWQHEGLDVGKNMDKAFSDIEQELDAKLAAFGWNKSVDDTTSLVGMLQEQGVKHAGVPMMEVREASKSREQRI